MTMRVLFLAGALLATATAAVQPAPADSAEAAVGWLGVYCENLSEAVRAALGVEQGALVGDVADGSPAAGAGIRQGDIITQVAGSPVTDASALRRLVQERPGREVGVTVLRRGERLVMTITLAARSRRDSAPWRGPTEDAMRMAARALRRVGEGEIPERVRAKILGFDEELEDIEELRIRVKALRAELHRELDQLRRELQERSAK